MEYSSPDSDSRPVSSPNFHGLGLGLGLEGLGLGLGLGLLGLEDSVRVLARVLEVCGYTICTPKREAACYAG